MNAKFEYRHGSNDCRIEPYGAFTVEELLFLDPEEGAYLPPYYHSAFVEWAAVAAPRDRFRLGDGTYWMRVPDEYLGR